MRYFFALFFLTLFFYKPVTAQQTEDTLAYSLSHYTDEDGLPQNSIKDIFQDAYGFIWLGTESGIVRFNGKDFRVFDKTSLSCMSSNRIRMIMNIEGMGSFALPGTGRRIQVKDGFAYCVPEDTLELSNLRIRWSLFPSKGMLIATGLPLKIGLWNTEKYIIPFGLHKYINCSQNYVYFRNKGITDTVRFNSQKDCRGFFTVGEELYFLDKNSVLTNIQPTGTRSCRIAGDLLSDKTYNRDSGRVFIFWNFAMRHTVFYHNRSFYDVERLPDGTLWTRLIYAGFDIGSNQIISHYYDRENKRLFLGSRVHGLFVLNNKPPFTILAEYEKPNKTYYALNIYDSIHLVTPRGVLLRQDSVVSFDLGMNYNRVDQTLIQLDHLGNIWTTGYGSVYRSGRTFNLKAKIHFTQEVTALYYSRYNSNLWIGLEKAGLYRLNVLDSLHTGVPRLVTSKIGLVTFMASESAEKLWIGSGKGLYLLNTVSNKLVCIDQFKDKNIRSIFVKTPDEIWITTYGDGIYLMRGNRLSHMPYDRNKSLLAPHCMILDHNDFFWISTNKGLIKASRKDLIAYAYNKQNEIFYLYFGKESGFNTNEFNGGCQPCGARLANGLITFPSLDGLVQISPGKESGELPDRELIIDRVEVNDRAIALQDTLTIPRKFDNLSIYLSTVYFGSRKNLQLSYMLTRNNKEDRWYPVKDNVIGFTSLPAGCYQLRIRKMNGFGTNNYQTISVHLIVPHAFYETVWFKLLIVAILLLLVYGYTRIRLYFILQRNRLLDLQIARRTRTLTNTLRALKVSEASLRRQTHMQEMLIAAISHDVKSPMKYLTMVSKRMQLLLSKKDYTSLTAFNESIQDTAGKVYTILDNLVTYISFQLKGGQIRREAVDIFKLVEDKISIFSAIAAVNNTVVGNNLAPDTFIEGDKDLLAVIIHNLIDNAVKFTANGRVEIYGDEPEEGRFALMIKDTGTGIPQELVQWLNTRSENGLDIGTIGSHKGMGLIIIKELLVAASADIHVVSGADGTTIKMYFEMSAPTDL